MRFLLVNQFYPPDSAPTGLYLHDLARTLIGRGHQAQVLCSRRAYNGVDRFPAHETRDGVEITRLPATGFGRRGFAGKLADYATFYGSLFAALMSRRWKPDVILSLTTPPYIGLLGKWAALRHRCRHAHWIMDLYPDVLFAHGMARKDGLLFWSLERLTRWQLRGADPVFALGPTMAEKVEAYVRSGAFANFVSWESLWSQSGLSDWPPDRPNPLRTERGWEEHETVFLYSGNMGLGHRFGEFLEAARRLGPSGPRWVFAGDGKRRAEIETFARSHPAARIEFLGYAPSEQLHSHLCSADVHLASLDSAWQGMIVPSKLQGSFAVGRPVLYVGCRGSETARWIREAGAGWVVDPNDIEGLLIAVQQAMDARERRKRAGAALDFARKHFQMSVNCARLAQGLEGARGGAPLRGLCPRPGCGAV